MNLGVMAPMPRPPAHVIAARPNPNPPTVRGSGPVVAMLPIAAALGGAYLGYIYGPKVKKGKIGQYGGAAAGAAAGWYLAQKFGGA